MRRPRTALACVMAVLVIALSASYLKAQMFGKRPPSPPPNPSPNPSAVPTAGFSPPAANRGARQLLRNGLDYLQTYQDPARAGRYLEEANTRRAELTPQEQASLDAALASVRTQVASQGSGSTSTAMAPLPPRPATAQVARSAPALPPLPTLSPVPNPSYGPEPSVVLTAGETRPPTEPEPLPVGEPIGLSVMTDPADQLVGLDSSGSVADEAQAEPLPAMPAQSPTLELQPEPLPAESPAQELQAKPVPAQPAEPPALKLQAEPASEAPLPLDAAEPPALPALPGPALDAAEPEALEPPPLAAPASAHAPAPAPEGIMPVLPADASLAEPPTLPAPVSPVAEPGPEDLGLIQEPPVEAAPAPEPAMIAEEPAPRELGTPAMAELPEPAPNPSILSAGAAPTDVMPVEPPPAPDASELPGIDLSNLAGEGPSPTHSLRSSDQEGANPPVSPPPAQAPAPAPVRQAQAPSQKPAQAPVSPSYHDPQLDPASPGAPIPQGTATLSPETLREIEELARRQEEDMRRNPSPYDTPPPLPGGRGGPSMGPTPGSLGYPADPSGSRAELPRAPSPTEARPIRPIEVPEETVQLPPRVFQPNRKYWSSPATCTMPLYFQDAVLERYGQSVEQAMGPAGRYLSYPLDDPTQSNQRMQILQPFYSAGMFALQVAALPYNLVVDPPWEAHYQLGYFRPGDPTPPDLYYLPTTGLGPPLHGKKYGRGYNKK